MKESDVLIIGAGAAGLMCAIEAGKRGRSVTILEKARKPGRKILISGGGRCNFTNLNTSPENYLSQNPHFCKSALARYTPWHFLELFSQHGLSYNEKAAGQLFCDQKATAVVDMLLQACEEVAVKIICDCEISEITTEDKTFIVASNQGQYAATSLVIASGGPSIPKMGSTDFSQGIARQFGLKSIPFKPALVPLTFAKNAILKGADTLAGLSLPVSISCNNTSFEDQLLFTHRGISGPAVLQISSYWNKGDTLEINLVPAINFQHWFAEERHAHANSLLSTALTKLLPKRLA